MIYDPEKHHRRSIRLRGYDYARSGLYFVTLVTHERECLFGDILDGSMCLNQQGRVVDEEWRRCADMRREVTLDAYIIMPNHLHAVVSIVGADGRPPGSKR